MRVSHTLDFVWLMEELRKITYGELVTVVFCGEILEITIESSDGKTFTQGIDISKLPTHQLGITRSEALDNAIALISMKAEIALHPTAHPPSERVH